MHSWLMVLGQLQQTVDFTTAAGVAFAFSMHAHTAWQTVVIKRHVDAKIDAKLGKHLKERHS